MTRDPLLPVRLVDGVWISAEPAVASPIVDDPFTPTPPSTGARSPWQEPGVKVRNMRCIPEPDLSEIVVPVTMDAEHVLAHGQRMVFAAVALDGSGVWAIGDSEEDARALAVERRQSLRNPIVVGDDFPPPSTDAAWLGTLALVTLSGTTDSLRALIKSMETGDPVAPWCPADLWDSGDVAP